MWGSCLHTDLTTSLFTESVCVKVTSSRWSPVIGPFEQITASWFDTLMTSLRGNDVIRNSPGSWFQVCLNPSNMFPAGPRFNQWRRLLVTWTVIFTDTRVVLFCEIREISLLLWAHVWDSLCSVSVLIQGTVNKLQFDHRSRFFLKLKPRAGSSVCFLPGLLKFIY